LIAGQGGTIKLRAGEHMAAVHSDQVLRDEAKEILEHRNGIRSGASAPTEGDKDVSLRQKLMSVNLLRQ
jgi:hypothetical protein